jgi:hypothetical protein
MSPDIAVQKVRRRRDGKKKTDAAAEIRAVGCAPKDARKTRLRADFEHRKLRDLQ